VILLDNSQRLISFHPTRPRLNIRETDEPMTVHGNGGDLTTYKKAYIENYGDVSFDDNDPNILCLKKMSGKVPVTYDSAGEALSSSTSPMALTCALHTPMAYITMTQ
jgi:hypothetical protein